jgi:putative transposase
VKFAFIHAERAKLPARRPCATLGVSHSGYYAWVGRPPSGRPLGMPSSSW